MKQGHLESLELSTYDSLVRWRSKDRETSQRVSLIKVTEKDIQSLGRWPISDGVLAQALERLLGYSPRAIGLDIYRDVPVPPGHDALNAVLSNSNNIIGTMKMPETSRSGVSGPPILRQNEQIGFNDTINDSDGIVRRGLLFMDDGETTESSFALRLVLRYLQSEEMTLQPDPSISSHIRLGDVTLPPLEADFGSYVNVDAAGYQFFLDHRESPDNFSSFSLSKLLSGEVKPSAINDRIVIVGVSAISVKDNFYTPLSRKPQAPQTVRGLELHAIAASQLLRHALDGQPPVKTFTDKLEIVWMLVWCILGVVMGLHGYSLVPFFCRFVVGLLVIFSLVYLSFTANLWIPFVAPAIAWVLSITLSAAYTAYQEKQKRTQLMGLFSQHVAPEVAEEIWQHRDQFMSGGRPQPQRLTATVMFTDICGFTSISERLSPPVLVDWLNEYMEAVTPLVAQHGGVVTRFVGDAIMAVFGAPIPRETAAQIQIDAQNAVKCALAMEQRLKERNHDWRERDLPVASMRLGIYTGDMVAGSVGAYQRMEYTLHGDCVNIAARLESFDKEILVPDPFEAPCRILIGESTVSFLDERFEIEEVQTVSLRGKDRKVTIFRVLRKI